MRVRQLALTTHVRLLALLAATLGACAPAQTPTVPELATNTPLPTAAPTPQQARVATPFVSVPATSIRLSFAEGLAIDSDGSLYVAQCDNTVPALIKVDPLGLATAIAEPNQGFAGDGGPVGAAQFQCPAGMAFDHDGNLYVADFLNNRIRRIDRSGIVTTVAGSGSVFNQVTGNPVGGFGGDGGPATLARLWGPTSVAFDADGNLYIVDGLNNRIRMVNHQGMISTIAGTGQEGYSGDGGPATAAELNILPPPGGALPAMIAFDADGNLFIANSYNRRVRNVDRHGSITTIAGTGDLAQTGDGGPATEAALALPTGLAFDHEGNLYVGEAPSAQVNFSRVRKIDRDGIITTVAGTGQSDESGDGGPATLATLRSPSAIAFDGYGNLFIADISRVRKVDGSGVITTFVGGGY